MGGFFWILKGGFEGREGGVAIYENPGFPVSKPGVSQSQGNGSRFVLDAPPQEGFTRMGWLDPVTAFGKLISAELVHYAYPYVNMMAYSRTRPEWHNLFCANAALREWLLASEEHAFYLYAIKVLAPLVMQKPATLKPCDREMVLVMERVHSSDLADEMGFVRTFRYHNDIFRLCCCSDCPCPQCH